MPLFLSGLCPITLADLVYQPPPAYLVNLAHRPAVQTHNPRCPLLLLPPKTWALQPNPTQRRLLQG